jgi:hypothetical protein
VPVWDNVEIYCIARQATWQYGPCALHSRYLRLQTHAQNIPYLLCFHCNNGLRTRLIVTLYILTCSGSILDLLKCLFYESVKNVCIFWDQFSVMYTGVAPCCDHLMHWTVAKRRNSSVHKFLLYYTTGYVGLGQPSQTDETKRLTCPTTHPFTRSLNQSPSGWLRAAEYFLISWLAISQCILRLYGSSIQIPRHCSLCQARWNHSPLPPPPHFYISHHCFKSLLYSPNVCLSQSRL